MLSCKLPIFASFAISLNGSMKLGPYIRVVRTFSHLIASRKKLIRTLTAWNVLCCNSCYAVFRDQLMDDSCGKILALARFDNTFDGICYTILQVLAKEAHFQGEGHQLRLGDESYQL